jgi:hypothetical protein
MAFILLWTKRRSMFTRRVGYEPGGDEVESYAMSDERGYE